MDLNKLRLLSGIPIKSQNKTVVIVEKDISLEQAKKIVLEAEPKESPENGVLVEEGTFVSNGEEFESETFDSVDAANAFMEKNPDYGLIRVDKEKGKYHVAKTKPIKKTKEKVDESTGSFRDDTNAVTWENGEKPVNVMSKENTLYHPVDQVEHELETMPYPTSSRKMSGDEEVKINVPTKLKSSLRSKAKEMFDMEEQYRTVDPQSASFMLTAGHALEDLLNHLEDDTDEGIKKAQIFMSSLMGPIQELIPDEVYRFIIRGGTPRTVSNIFKEIRVNNQIK